MHDHMNVHSDRIVPYGNWGYGIQTPIADHMRSDIDKRKQKLKEEISTTEHMINAECIKVLEEYVDSVDTVETAYSSSIVSKSREDSLSGRGRGDSMG